MATDALLSAKQIIEVLERLRREVEQDQVESWLPPKLQVIQVFFPWGSDGVQDLSASDSNAVFEQGWDLTDRAIEELIEQYREYFGPEAMPVLVVSQSQGIPGHFNWLKDRAAKPHPYNLTIEVAVFPIKVEYIDDVTPGEDLWDQMGAHLIPYYEEVYPEYLEMLREEERGGA